MRLADEIDRIGIGTCFRPSMLIALIGHDDDGAELAVRDHGQPGGNADALAVEQAHDVVGAGDRFAATATTIMPAASPLAPPGFPARRRLLQRRVSGPNLAPAPTARQRDRLAGDADEAAPHAAMADDLPTT